MARRKKGTSTKHNFEPWGMSGIKQCTRCGRFWRTATDYKSKCVPNDWSPCW